MARNRLTVCFAALALGAAAFGLSSCGRAGPPEPPPPGGWGLGWGFGLPSASAAPPGGPAVNAAPAPPTGQTAANPTVPGASASPQATAAKNGFDVNGNPVAPPGQKKSFLLDPILQ